MINVFIRTNYSAQFSSKPTSLKENSTFQHTSTVSKFDKPSRTVVVAYLHISIFATFVVEDKQDLVI